MQVDTHGYDRMRKRKVAASSFGHAFHATDASGAMTHPNICGGARGFQSEQTETVPGGPRLGVCGIN